MDCRKPLFLVLSLVVGVGGCTPSLSSLRGNSASSSGDDIVHTASTYTAFGDFRAKSAEAADLSPAQRQSFREDARLSYLKALEMDRKYLPAYVGLAKIQQAADDHAGAAKVYAKALELGPEEPGLWFELGMCQCRSKEWSAALVNLRKAAELAPTNRQYATMMGYALARAGQWDESFAVLARVQGQAKAHYDLARMLLHVNQPEMAWRHAAAAHTADPNFEAARALVAELNNRRTAQTVAQALSPPVPGLATPQVVTPASQMARPAEMPAIGQTNQVIQPTGATAPQVSDQMPAVTGGESTPQARMDRPIPLPPLPVIKLP